MVNSNFTNGSSEQCSLDDLNAEETEERIPAIIFLSVSMVIGIFGNSLVLVVYFRTLKRRLRAHWIFIRALAITDFLVCAIVIPFELFQQSHQLTFYNEGSCKFFRSLTVYSTIISAFLMVAISSDRLRLVCWPTSPQLTPKQALIIIIVIACGSIAFSWPEGVLSGISLEYLECNLTGYDCSFSDRSSEHTTTYSAVLFSVFIICMFALVIMYSIITYQVLRRTKQTLKKITKIAVVISLCFICSYIPYSVIKLNGAIKKGIFTNRLPDGLFPILARMFVINNIVNPIVYGFLDATFREHCVILCQRIKHIFIKSKM